MKNYIINRQRINEAKPQSLERLACEALEMVSDKVKLIRDYAKRNRISLETYTSKRLNGEKLEGYGYINEQFSYTLGTLSILIDYYDSESETDLFIKAIYHEDAEVMLCNLLTANFEVSWHFINSDLHDTCSWWLEVINED